MEYKKYIETIIKESISYNDLDEKEKYLYDLVKKMNGIRLSTLDNEMTEVAEYLIDQDLLVNDNGRLVIKKQDAKPTQSPEQNADDSKFSGIFDAPYQELYEAFSEHFIEFAQATSHIKDPIHTEFVDKVNELVADMTDKLWEE